MAGYPNDRRPHSQRERDLAVAALLAALTVDQPPPPRVGFLARLTRAAGQIFLFALTLGALVSLLLPQLATSAGPLSGTAMPVTPTPGRSLDRLAFVAPGAGGSTLYLSEGGVAARPLQLGGLQAYAPAWSPDGLALVFVVYDGEQHQVLFRVNADGSDLLNLSNTPPGVVDGSPAWSPDGTRIAFTSDRAGGFDIHLMRADGGAVERLTFSLGVERSPIWLDSQRLLYVAQLAAGWGLIELDTLTLAQRVIYQTTDELRFPALSPDRRRVALTQHGPAGADIYTVELADGAAARVTTHRGIDDQPTWSSAGEIVFVSLRSGAAALYRVDAAGAAVPLPLGVPGARDPAWWVSRARG